MGKESGQPPGARNTKLKLTRKNSMHKQVAPAQTAIMIKNGIFKSDIIDSANLPYMWKKAL
jgi:hypothetical protein